MIEPAAVSATASPIVLPRSLFLFALIYGGMVCMAGVLGNKLLALGPLGVEGGILAFLVLVVTASATAELFGRDVANRLVRWGFVPMLLSMALIQVILLLPTAAAMPPERLAAFDVILAQGARLMFAGLIAYGTSQTLNVMLFSALKLGEGRRLLWLRAGIASVASQIVDTFLFVTIAFYGVFPIGGLIVGQMIAKTVLSAVLVPPAVYAMVALGRRLDGVTP